MSRMTHCLDAVHRSMSVIEFLAQNVQGDSLPGCKFTVACQQLNLSSECPG